jgi:hypothetical protein
VAVGLRNRELACFFFSSSCLAMISALGCARLTWFTIEVGRLPLGSV